MRKYKKSESKSFVEFLWDLFCISTFIGIWPRFIEPQLICTTHLKLPIQKLNTSLEGLKIVQFSDLHLSHHMSNAYLAKLTKKILSLAPDLIVFTGDFICYSLLKEPEKLKDFLCTLKAPHGCYAILGNHDYAEFVSINDAGDYDVLDTSSSSLRRAFKRLLIKTKLSKVVTKTAQRTPQHQELVQLLTQTPFQLLHNKTIQIAIKESAINLTGLGEYMLGRCDPIHAFKDYDKTMPGIILLHNPDGAPLLQGFPGDIVLCGHTHGGQVNLPWMWRKFTLLEHMEFKKGLVHVDGRPVYINRGIGSVLPFRWFSPPELLLLTLENDHGP